MFAVSGSYALLFFVLLWAALRGQSIVAPDAVAVASLVIWAVGTMLVLGWIGLSSRRSSCEGMIGSQYDTRIAHGR
jgi:hypothetical protein